MTLVSIVVAEEVAPEQSGVGNVWDGIWHSEMFAINLSQNGDIVSGPYVSLDPDLMISGFIDGTLSEDGNVLQGTWTETGDVAFTLSDDASSFQGIWGYNETIDAIVENNTGSWTGTWNSANNSLNLVQDGNVVSGTYISINPEFIDETGTVEGSLSENEKELTGTWTESGGITFILAPDGSVFNGTYTYGSGEPVPGNTWNATRIE